MRRIIAAVSTAALAIGILAGPTLAAQPTDPGCFGRDRAEWIKANSGRAWGDIASDRAGDNASINADYRANTCS